MSSNDKQKSFYKRKRFVLIYPEFQVRLLVANALLFAAGLAVIAFHSWYSFYKMRQIGVALNLPESHVFFRFIAAQSAEFFSIFALGVVVALSLSAAATVVLTHRVAGPIVRMRSWLREIREQRAEERRPLSFREDDYFAELAPELNRALGVVDKNQRKAS